MRPAPARDGRPAAGEQALMAVTFTRPGQAQPFTHQFCLREPPSFTVSSCMQARANAAAAAAAAAAAFASFAVYLGRGKHCPNTWPV